MTGAKILFKFNDGEVIEVDALEFSLRERAQLAALLRHLAHEQALIEQAGVHGGFKGGRPSRKPFDVEIRRAFEPLAKLYSDGEARAQLVKSLAKKHFVSPSTARRWVAAALSPS